MYTHDHLALGKEAGVVKGAVMDQVAHPEDLARVVPRQEVLGVQHGLK